jgi:flagellin
MKLSAASKRSTAVNNNIGNVTSYLQTQDGVLKTTGKVLDRMSELYTLAQDPTKNADDVSNYGSEFTQLQTELRSLTGETFNGIKLFGADQAAGVIVKVNAAEDGSTTANIDITAKDLAANAGVGKLLAGVTLSANQVTVALESAYATFLASSKNAAAVTAFKAAVTTNVATSAEHTALDTAVDNFATAFTAGTLAAAQFTAMSNAIDAAKTQGTAGAAVTLATLKSGNGLGDITDAIKNVATMRATNGAEQSRLGFASEVLSVNKTNIEAATSRIMDVDVASESTQLARWNILVQAGTAMLSQANQSAQSALKLLQ